MNRTVVCLVVVLAAVLGGCSSFTNTSVVSRRLAITDHAAVEPQDADVDYGFRVVRVQEDGSVEISIDDSGGRLALVPGQWADLPLSRQLVVRRIKLIESNADGKSILVDYQEGVESGPPVLRRK